MADVVVRQQELDWAVRTLREGTSVLLVGDEGSGKTFLKNAIAATLPEPDFTVVRVTASTGRSQLRWGALGASLDLTDLDPSDGRLVEMRLDERIAELRATATSRLVILVEDALLLDRESAEWVGRVVRESSAVLLAAMDRGARDVDTDRSDTERVLRLLWTDGVAERCDLSRLDETASLRLADTFGGGVLDRATQLYIAHHASGVPLLIRELVLDQLERRAEDRGEVIRLAQPALAAAPFAASGPRAYDLSRMRVTGLTVDQKETLAVLAQFGTMPQRRAAHLAGAEILAALTRRGHVTADPATPGYVYAVDMDAGSTAALLDTRPASPIVRHALDTILDDQASGLQMSSLEALFVATQWRDDPSGACHSARLRFSDGFVAGILVLGAAQANVSGRPDDALEISRCADRIRPSTTAAIEMAKALASLGQGASARAVLDRAHPAQSVYEDDLAWFRAVTRLMRFDPTQDVRALIDRAAAWYPNDPTFAGERVLAGLVPMDATHSQVGVVCAVIEDAQVDVLSRLWACGDAALYAAYEGRRETLARAAAVARRLGETPLDDPYDQLQLRATVVAVFCELTVAQIALWEQLERLESDIDGAISASIQHHDYSHLASLGAAAGILAAARGDYRRAETELRTAGARYTGSEPIGWTAWAACEHAAVLAMMGRADEAERRLAGVRNVGSPEAAWYSHSYRSARVQLRRARGQLDEARREAMSIASDNALSPIIQVHQHFVAVALGEPADVVAPESSRLAAATGVPALHAMAAFLTARLAADTVAAHAAAERLEQLGLPWAATLAFDQVAACWAEAGDKRRSAEAAAKAADLIARMRGDSLPQIPAIDLTALSSREREIVELVATGSSNREISERLFLSVRTVESHVYRVLRKLALDGRGDLIAADLTTG
ncbi:MAG: LuxR C-terminal-related transcriptional regulator [Cryobacterium sp.]